jgi:antitoxin (DNA-binding transcriptional repressor) of toxin-antitoxin stability system
MATITIQQAQMQLPELIEQMKPGEELMILKDNQPVAKLLISEQKKAWPCQAGSAKGKIKMSPDFDEPLEEFKEYME